MATTFPTGFSALGAPSSAWVLLADNGVANGTITCANLYTYINSSLLGATSGLLKANGAGVISAAVASTDYAPATLGSAILKGNGAGGFSSAVASTDYAPATLGSAILKGNGAGGFASAVAGTDFVAVNGALGTPSSGTLTNCSGLPANGVAAAGSSGQVILNSSGAYGGSVNLTFATATLTIGVAASTSGILSLSNATAGSAILTTDGNNILALRNGGTAGAPVGQTFRVYNFYVDASNYAHSFIDSGVSAANTLTFGFNGAGTGATQLTKFIFSVNGVTKADYNVFNSNQWQFVGGMYTGGNITAIGAGRFNNSFIGLGYSNNGIVVSSNVGYGFSNTSGASGGLVAPDTQLSRNAAGVVEINNGTAGTFRDLTLRNIIPGASLSTAMTDGFYNIPGAAGTPTGVPNNTTGFPMYYDSTNNKLYAYNGAWRGVTLT